MRVNGSFWEREEDVEKIKAFRFLKPMMYYFSAFPADRIPQE